METLFTTPSARPPVLGVNRDRFDSNRPTKHCSARYNLLHAIPPEAAN